MSADLIKSPSPGPGVRADLGGLVLSKGFCGICAVHADASASAWGSTLSPAPEILWATLGLDLKPADLYLPNHSDKQAHLPQFPAVPALPLFKETLLSLLMSWII